MAVTDATLSVASPTIQKRRVQGVYNKRRRLRIESVLNRCRGPNAPGRSKAGIPPYWWIGRTWRWETPLGRSLGTTLGGRTPSAEFTRVSLPTRWTSGVFLQKESRSISHISRIPQLSITPGRVRCRANMAYVRQSRPNSGLGFQVKVLRTF